ncbi:hypothetical protein [Salidesulfovibrio onnuriiensis]|uniref:VgrG-related protein n=1 Tax=Salidesulfovibrio onnuriiensis TaxID=2583823 RepID=UPI0011CC0FCB|nr:hypothetical protein [Salidesulfovibrio onnuriiensis]
MSFGADKIYDVLQTMSPTTVGNGKVTDPAQLKQLQAAFQNQMQMADSLFGMGRPQESGGQSASSFDSGLMNDALMFDALSSITRIMQQNSGRMKPMKAIQSYEAQAIPRQVKQAVDAASPEIREVLGSLSAMFESGSRGSEAIGYDRVGGTSYGKYQIASKVGTMDRFISFLDTEKPEWGEQLRNAGPADTGSKSGRMPEVWKELAEQHPEEFERLQTQFIRQETYDPARNMILDATGIDMNNAPKVVQEVLWSTSVQHGATGASRIFGKVIDSFMGASEGADFNQKLIEGVYDKRKGQFGSSSARVQASVKSRLEREKDLALNMLESKPLSRIV